MNLIFFVREFELAKGTDSKEKINLLNVNKNGEIFNLLKTQVENIARVNT